MTETLARRRDKMAVFGLRVQPVVVLVGSIEQPSAAYVVVDSATWKVSTALKAVDLCFKAFHVFHAAYPSETFVWLLLQKVAYKMITKWDVKSAAVSALIADLRHA